MSSPHQGGLDALKMVREASHVHEAVALWWARALLSMQVDTLVRPTETPEERIKRQQLEERLREAALELRPEVQKNISGFAAALLELTTERNVVRLSVGDRPDTVLFEAAGMADLPVDAHASIFPPHSYTQIVDDGTLAIGRLGARALPQRVWPPVPGS